MTMTTIVIVNSILAAAVVYGLVHLLGHGIHSDRKHHRQVGGELRALPERSSERIAA